jgi:predicted transport protein
MSEYMPRTAEATRECIQKLEEHIERKKSSLAEYKVRVEADVIRMQENIVKLEITLAAQEAAESRNEKPMESVKCGVPTKTNMFETIELTDEQTVALLTCLQFVTVAETVPRLVAIGFKEEEALKMIAQVGKVCQELRKF